MKINLLFTRLSGRMATHALIDKHLRIYRRNLVCMLDLSYNMHSGWWAGFGIPFRTYDANSSEKTWGNSSEAADALSTDEYEAVMYVLLMHIRDRIPVQTPSGAAPESRIIKKLKWVDTGILWHDKINIQIRYFPPQVSAVFLHVAKFTLQPKDTGGSTLQLPSPSKPPKITLTTSTRGWNRRRSRLSCWLHVEAFIQDWAPTLPS